MKVSPDAITAGVAALRQRREVPGDEATRLAVCFRALGEMNAHTSPANESKTKGLANMARLRDMCDITKAGAVEMWWLAGALLSLREGEGVFVTSGHPDDFAAMMRAPLADEDDAISAAVVTDVSELMDLELTSDCRVIQIRGEGEEPARSFIGSSCIFVLRYSFTFGDFAAIDVYESAAPNHQVITETVAVDAFDASALASMERVPERLGARRIVGYVKPAVPEPIDHAPAQDRSKREPVSPVFDVYRPRQATSPLTRPHPSRLIVPKTLDSVDPPPITARPRLETRLLTDGVVSDAQFEAVCMALTAFSKHNLAKVRYGYLLADGTGAGKTITGCAMYVALRNEGIRRGIYITEKKRHRANVERDLVRLGLPAREIIDLDNYPAGTSLPLRDGMLFATYSQIRKVDGNRFPRVEQIIEWVGENWEGLLVLDESHNLRNTVPEDTGGYFGSTPSNQGLAGAELQDRLPQARVLYSSATGASDAHNLGYMKRLGLWGPGCYFPTSEDLIAEVNRSGLSGLEIISTSLVAAGLMCARTLSLEGIDTSALIHQMTPREKDTWNEVIGLLNRIDATLPEAWKNALGRDYVVAPQDISAHYEATSRRVTELMLTCFKTPTMITSMRRDIDCGDAPVVQLKNTYEGDADDEAKTLASQMIALVDLALPLQRMYRNTSATRAEQGRMSSYLPVKLDDGRTVPVPANEVLREALVKDIERLPLMKTPLDQVIDAFGADTIAEITGRQSRTVPSPYPGGARITEKRSESLVVADLAAFMGDRKRILAFSVAMGGASMDYHASIEARNQRKRKHYVLQAGDRADLAVQGIGRTHRSNQKQPPDLIVVSASQRAEQVYRTQTMKRMRRLGAAGQGHRDAASGTAFSMRDSFDSEYTRAAFLNLMLGIAENRYPDIQRSMFESTTKLSLVSGERIAFTVTDQFFNRVITRLARTTTDFQDTVFGQLDVEIENVVRSAVTDRTFDTGPETLSEDVTIVDEERIAVDPRTGAILKAYHVAGVPAPAMIDFETALREADLYNTLASPPRCGWSPQTNQVFLTVTTEVDEKGFPSRCRVIEPNRSTTMGANDFLLRHAEYVSAFDTTQQRSHWEGRVNNLKNLSDRPAMIFAGAIPLIYGEIKTDTGVMRPVVGNATDGRRIMGLMVDEERGREIKLAAALGASERMNAAIDLSKAIAALDAGETLVLDNGWMISVQSVAGKDELELSLTKADSACFDQTARKLGLVKSRVGAEVRWLFKRDRSDRISALRPLLSRNPIVRTTMSPDWSTLG